MRDRFVPTNLLIARLLVWAGLSALFLWYLRWGSEIISLTSYYHMRQSVPYVWDAFHSELPDIGNSTMLDVVYWVAIGTSVVGVLALFWLALVPSAREAADPDGEQPPA